MGVLTLPLKICSRGQSMFDPSNVTLFHSKLLLDYSASFTPSRMTDVSTMEGKTNFSKRMKQFDGLT